MSESERDPILTVGEIREERGLAMLVEGVLVQHAARMMADLRGIGIIDERTTRRVLLNVSARLLDIAAQGGKLDVEPVREGVVQIPEPGDARRLEAGKKAKASKADGDEGRTCPICGVSISKKAVGCKKHWREVKRRLEPGWEDERKVGIEKPPLVGGGCGVGLCLEIDFPSF